MSESLYPPACRDLQQIWEDNLWPRAGLMMGPDPEESLRHQAIAQVLCALPEDAYQRLREAADSFHWFIPSVDTLGGIEPFPITRPSAELSPGGVMRSESAAVLWLSPMLERTAWDITSAVAAHEIAHLVLKHDLYGRDYEAQEDEAWQLVRDWGYEQQERRHAARAK